MTGRGDLHRKTKQAVGRDPTQKTVKSILLGPTKFLANSRTTGTFGIGQAASSS